MKPRKEETSKQTANFDEANDRRRFNWRGNWIADSGDRWRNLKVIRNRHRVRESVIAPGKLTFHLITVYMGAPSRQQTRFENRNLNILQTSGDVVVIPAQTTLRSVYDDVEQDDIYLHLEPDFIKKTALESDLNPDGTELVPILGTRNPQIEQLAKLAFAELQHDEATVGSNLYADSLANLLAVELLRSYSTRAFAPEPTNTNALPKRKLAQILDLINSDLSADLSLAFLAETVGLSEYHFLRLFKQSTGATPHQYVLRQRIERAKQLLLETQLSVTEISFLLGFSTPAHFAQQFRRQTGVQPTELRRR
ncbi:MAG: helix-turn-helix domain-containing protein [Acidobacteriota bacterium]|nr:helix-turn-helix domain-containing protein [Acidobacteriota bacterium]